MRLQRSLSTTLIIPVVMVCAALAQDVRTNFMPSTDFSKFHSYRRVNIEGGAHPNQIVDQEIKQAIDSELASKGLTKTETEQADLYVGYQTAIDQEKQWNGYGVGGGVRWGGMTTATSSTISNGTLVLDMYDPTKKQLVWSGAVSKTLNPSSNPEKNQKNLDKAVSKMLKNFPPKQK